MFLLILLSTLVITLYFIYRLLAFYLSANNDYWPKLGVPVVHPGEYGSLYELMSGKKKVEGLNLFYYTKHKDAPYVGIMEGRKPVILIRDMELLKRVLVKDFEYFVNRRDFPLSGDDFINSKNLSNMHGQHWKDTRAVISPTFSTGKIRRMFDHFSKSGLGLMKYIRIINDLKNKGENNVDPDYSTDLREVFGRYTMDIVASTAFGMDSQCLPDKDQQDNSIFLKMGRKFLDFNVMKLVKIFMIGGFPTISSFLGISFFDKETMHFFANMARQTIQKRRAEGSAGKYTDFLALLMDPSDEGEDEENTVIKSKSENSGAGSGAGADGGGGASPGLKLADDYIIANSMAFLIAGFDTTESVLTFATYQMAVCPEMQERAYKEIKECVQESGGQLTYDVLNKLYYLEMFISEVMRVHPPSPRAERAVTKDYQIPDSNIILKEGTPVVISIIGFHQDEKYFPEPQKFDPERFSAENKANRPPFAYIPFGHGPRNCIGMRFSLVAIKSAIAQLVYHYHILPCKETMIPIKYEPFSGIFIKPAKELKVALKPRFEF